MNDNISTAREEIAARAAAWAVRLRAEDVSDADWIAATEWLDADPIHRAAFASAEALWAASDGLTKVSGAEVVKLTTRRERRPAVGRPWLAAIPALAAAVAAAVFLPPIWQGAPTTVYRTAPGELRTVVLEDGSRINLNGDSSLSVRMERGRRLVQMDQAEAAFDVAHEEGRPFLVTVGESQVRVVGTAFNIRRTRASTEVTVMRGVVEVSDREAPASKVRLTVGDQVRRADLDDRMVTSRADPRSATSWLQGTRAYTDRPLVEVAADLSRAFKHPVTVAPDASNLRFSGVLVLDDETAVLDRLTSFLPVRAAREDGGVRLERR